MNKSLLKVENLTMKFGGLTAIDSLSFSANNNEITSIIGPNGAGKTTVFNCLTGFYKPTDGEMFLSKNDETISLKKFASGYSIFGILNLRRYKDKEREAVEKAKYWLDIIGLTNRADDNAGDLPYGDQRKLEIVRAMCIEPRLLCLDEPAAGLNPKESSELNKLLEFIKNDKKTGILLIEHDMSVVMGISDHVVVLNYGKKIFQGSPIETRNSKEVIEAYLGVDE